MGRARGAAGRRAPGGLLLVAVGAALAAVLAVAATRSFWVAGLLLAAVLLGLGVARAALPVAVLGPLAVRSRWVDVLTCLVLGVSTAVLAVVAPGGLRG